MFISNSFSLSLNVNNTIVNHWQKNQRLAIAIGCIACIILSTAVLVYKICSHFWLNRKVTSKPSSTVKENQPQNRLVSEIESPKKVSVSPKEEPANPENSDKDDKESSFKGEEKPLICRVPMNSASKKFNPQTPIDYRARSHKEGKDSEEDKSPFKIDPKLVRELF